MATVRLRDTDLDEELPPVCICCGAEATVFKAKKFSWQPGWVALLLLVGLLPYIIVAIILTKRMTVQAPLCEQHRNHWGGRSALLLLTFLGLIVLAIGGAVVLPEHGQKGMVLVIGCVTGLIAWVILAVIVQNGTVRPSEITDNSITLQSVAPEFRDAMQEPRRGRHDLDREASERWNKRRERRNEGDRYKDDEPSRRVRPPDDRYQDDQ
jgi:hypothetical protein